MYKISTIARKLKVNERTCRKLLRLNEIKIDGEELVTRSQLINVLADAAGTRESRLLANLLTQ